VLSGVGFLAGERIKSSHGTTVCPLRAIPLEVDAGEKVALNGPIRQIF
jgi:hypothetical protein